MSMHNMSHCFVYLRPLEFVVLAAAIISFIATFWTSGTLKVEHLFSKDCSFTAASSSCLLFKLSFSNLILSLFRFLVRLWWFIFLRIKLTLVWSIGLDKTVTRLPTPRFSYRKLFCFKVFLILVQKLQVFLCPINVHSFARRTFLLSVYVASACARLLSTSFSPSHTRNDWNLSKVGTSVFGSLIIGGRSFIAVVKKLPTDVVRNVLSIVNHKAFL